MSEVLHFIVNSPEKFILDYMIDLYEKKPKNTIYEKVDYMSWLNVFNCEDGEKRIFKIMSKLYPQGAKLNVDKFNEIFKETLKFIKQDKDAKQILVECRKNYFTSYVYSICDNCVKYACYGYHGEIILKLTQNFFGKLYEYAKEDIFNFIMKNFKIKGSSSTLFKFASDISELYGGQI